jgi:hypothetical protein
MDHPTLEDRIRQIKVTVALERDQIARQRALIAALEKRGDRTGGACLALRVFEVKERTDIAQLKRLTAELALLGAPHGASPSVSKWGK